MQIGAEMAAGEIDALIFLRDPLTAHPHEPDVAALLRVADVHNVALATNLAGADASCVRLPRRVPWRAAASVRATDAIP